ncbi:DUF5666 domain-containing protein [Antrihabitans sp. YC2-6]|uniref:DUF5666 domain-containing protein n=1 Tax=Antrihabitans sp. YC2-6 TaxID=2799498 RepID=UPI0018F57DD3|nr:DUF5666 domain-containing protein [Antrihabitans sp. YC2-6]MBJ8348974.1 hypothetical protein [Antrihabitans sp. YC2-6]
MTNPNDPRDPKQGPPPSEEPTQYYGSSGPTDQYPLPGQGQPDGGYYTSDPYAAYGSSQPNPTQAFPAYQPGGFQQGDPNQQYGQYPGNQGQWDPNAYPGEVPPLDGRRGSSRKGLWIALAAVLALVVVGGLAAFLLVGGDDNKDDKPTAAGATTSEEAGATTTRRPSTTRSPSTEATIIPSIPDILEGIGIASGKITAIDGSTITIDPAFGEITKITTSDDTVFITSSGPGSLDDLAVGQEVNAQGTSSGDTLEAAFITNLSLGDFPN